jgi:hypothetical protein
MAVSAVDLIIEANRQLKTGDINYAKVGSWVFVLKGPKNAGPLGPMGSAQFPLPINPRSFNYSLPFSEEITPLQEGGVVSEENGIVIGEITIEGTTGFKLRELRDTSFCAGGGEFTGELTAQSGASASSNDKISGQYAFWRIANRCFDGYSALKKDPNHAAETSMELHIEKDQLHLAVKPREFVLRRDASDSRVTYNYSIRLAVVGVAESIEFASPDDNLLTDIKNSISRIRSGVQSLSAALDDTTASLDEITRTISSAAEVMSDVKRVINSYDDLLTGTKRFLSMPKAMLRSIQDQVEAIGALSATSDSWPPDVAQNFRTMGDMMDRLLMAGTAFYKPTWEDRVRTYENKSLSAGAGLLREAYAAGGAVADGTTATADQLPGTGTTGTKVRDVFGSNGTRPGDARRSLIKRPSPRLNTKEYRGFREVVVGQGDTLQSIAAKHLGRSGQWLVLAILNDLKPPYISNNKLPNTLQVGSKILIPVRASAVTPDTITSSDTPVGDSQMEKHLGRDFEMVQTMRTNGRPSGLFGWAIDAAGGSTDVRRVVGIQNYSQALEMRFRTEKGFNILYPNLGLPRLVGQRGFQETLSDSNFAARQQLLSDKRTERVVSFRWRVEQDKVFIDADVQPVGFSTSRVISRAIT